MRKMNAFVLGASGYIGREVALSLREAGYRVFGAVRSDKYSKDLKKQEIIPVIGDVASQPDVFDDQLKSSVVIVDAVGYSPGSSASENLLNRAISLFEKTERTYRPLYIFTSGIMCYASGERFEHHITEELEPRPKDPIEMLPKMKLEYQVLNNTTLQGVVVRPGFVYGGSGGVIGGMFFNPTLDSDGNIVVWGSLDKRWSWVYYKDLGRAYALIALKRSTFGNETFNIAAGGDYPTWQEIIYEGARAAGWEGDKNKNILSVPVPEDQPRALNWEWNVMIDPRKPQHVLGWSPSRPSFLRDIQIYYDSFLASK